MSSYTTGHHSPFHFAAGAGHLPVLKILDKAAASEGKASEKKGGKKGKTEQKELGPVLLGPAIERASINSLTFASEPPIFRTILALGGRSAVAQGAVFQVPQYSSFFFLVEDVQVLQLPYHRMKPKPVSVRF